jgi:hypothetical protein
MTPAHLANRPFGRWTRPSVVPGDRTDDPRDESGLVIRATQHGSAFIRPGDAARRRHGARWMA